MAGNSSLESQTFRVDGFDYVLKLRECGSITLALVDGYILGQGYLSNTYKEYDPFERWEEYQPGVELFHDINIGVNVFQLVREVHKRINGWISRVRPSYFAISPNSGRKAPVYARTCRLLARRIRGYSVQQIGQTFYFYRLNTRTHDPDEHSTLTVSSDDTGSQVSMLDMMRFDYA